MTDPLAYFFLGVVAAWLNFACLTQGVRATCGSLQSAPRILWYFGFAFKTIALLGVTRWAISGPAPLFFPLGYMTALGITLGRLLQKKQERTFPQD